MNAPAHMEAARAIAEQEFPGWQHNDQLAAYLANAMAQTARTDPEHPALVGATSNQRERKAA